MEIYRPITVDLYRPYPLVIMNAKQGDTARGAIVTLTAGGSIMEPTTEQVRIYAKKPDGTKVYNDCTIQGGKVKIAFTNQLLAVAGTLPVELEMMSGNDILSTPIFVIQVLPTNIDSSAIESSDEFTALEDALQKVENLGNIDDTTVSFSQATVRSNIQSGETVSTIFGKIRKWFADISSGAVSTLLGDNLTTSRALTSDSSGKVAVSDVTSTELGYLAGVTSGIQGQINTLSTENATVEPVDCFTSTTNYAPIGTGAKFSVRNGVCSFDAAINVISRPSGWVNVGEVPIAYAPQHNIYQPFFGWLDGGEQVTLDVAILTTGKIQMRRGGSFSYYGHISW